MLEGLARHVRRLAERPSLLVTLYGVVIAAGAFALTHAALLVNDGHIYMEMARAMRHGSLEIANGLDVVDSPELWITHSVKRGLHLFAKYPPFYGIVAAVPYALFGLRGLYLVNAAALALAFPAFHLLARRVLTPERAKLATLLLPIGTPLVAFALMELPHLLAMTLMLWAVVLWDEARRTESSSRAAWAGLGTGLLAGIAFGIRLQDLFLALPLLAGSATARRRVPSLLGTGAGFLACVAIVSAFNAVRFGSPNPFSYGPTTELLGAPDVEETAGYFMQRGLVILAVIGIVSLLAARHMKSGRRAAGVLAAAGILVVCLPSARAVAARTLLGASSVLVNASIAGNGWESPDTTSGWMNKALLVSAPILVLGLVAVVRCAVRPAPPLQTALAWMVLLVVVFLSQRDPDPRSGMAIVGFFSLSPRYLVEVMPLLYLLAWWTLAEARLARMDLVVGVVAAAVFLFGLWASGPCDAPLKIALLTNAPIGLAALFLVTLALRGTTGRLSAPLVSLAHAVALACVIAEDGRALVGFGSVEERWGRQFLAAAPSKVAVVGWRFAKDAIFHVRSTRDAIIVDASVDDAASLADTLDALVADGRSAFYFGWGIERCAASLTGRYRVVPVLADPVVLRLDRIEGALDISARTPSRGEPGTRAARD